MIYILLITYIIVLSLLTFLILKILHEHKMKNDLVFFVITNYILSFSFLIFLFHFKDYLFSFVNMFLLLINTIFLNYEIKLAFNKIKILSLPYLIYITFIFYLIFDLFLMNL